MADGGREGDSSVPVQKRKIKIRKTHDGGPGFDGHFPTHQWVFMPVEQLTHEDCITLLCSGRLDFVIVPYFEVIMP